MLYTSLETHDDDEQTPNFAMDTADIALDADPAEWRCTSHLFEPKTLLCVDVALPSGSPVRVFESPEYPPAILYDIVYAGAVLHHFGTPAVKDGITTAWNNIYGVNSDLDAIAGSLEREHEIAEKARRKIAHKLARDGPGPDHIDMLKTLPLFLMIPREQLEAAVRRATEMEEAEEQKRVEEKVNEWIKTVVSG